jgi:hypothetical protein
MSKLYPLAILLLLLTFACSDVDLSNSATTHPAVVRQNSGVIYTSDFEAPWMNRDTLFFETAIDSLFLLPDHELLYKAYALSEVTGFGWTFMDVVNLDWLDSLSDNKKRNVRNTVITGFLTYKKSNLFMKQLPHPISMHELLTYPLSDSFTVRDQVNLRRVLDSLEKNYVYIPY